MNDEYNVLRSQIATLEIESNWKSQIVTSNIKNEIKKNHSDLSQYVIPSAVLKSKRLAKDVRYE